MGSEMSSKVIQSTILDSSLSWLGGMGSKRLYREPANCHESRESY